MPLPAERTRFVEGHLCIQGLVAGIVGDDAPIVHYFEISAFKHLVFIRADKYEFYFFGIRHYEKFLLYVEPTILQPVTRTVLTDPTFIVAAICLFQQAL